MSKRKHVKEYGANHVSAGVKIAQFFKKNLYYVLMIVSILAIGSIITVATVLNSNKDPNVDVPNVENKEEEDQKDPPKEEDKTKPTDTDEDEKPQESLFELAMPLDDFQVAKAFTDSTLVWNPTQGQYSTHEGIDLKCEAGDTVKCVYKGTVTKVSKDSFYGGVVTVNHGMGYETTYKLLDDVKVKVGDKLSKGDAIGVVSNTALAESAEGPHLHLELTKDGKRINPLTFFVEGDK